MDEEGARAAVIEHVDVVIGAQHGIDGDSDGSCFDSAKEGCGELRGVEQQKRDAETAKKKAAADGAAAKVKADADAKEAAAKKKADYEAAGGRFVEHDRPVELWPGVWLTGPVPRVHPERNWTQPSARIRTESGIVEDNQWILDLAKDNPVIKGFVGHLEPGDSFGQSLARFSKNRLFRGIRLSGRAIATGLSRRSGQRLKVQSRTQHWRRKYWPISIRRSWAPS